MPRLGNARNDARAGSADLSAISELYTLGPEGTNCERAARQWFNNRGRAGRARLYSTLEQAVVEMPRRADCALMACIAYPDLNKLMFGNVNRLQLVDCLIMPTFGMVFAARSGVTPRTAVSHPAPCGLLPPGLDEIVMTTSNAQAAIDCRNGIADACITTRLAADMYGLEIRQDFGPIDMGFTIHAQTQLAKGV